MFALGLFFTITVLRLHVQTENDKKQTVSKMNEHVRKGFRIYDMISFADRVLCNAII